MLLLVVVQVVLCVLISAQLVPFYPNYTTHVCKRKCSVYESPKTCYYELHVEFLYTLEPNCMNCLNGTVKDCENTECIIADGRRRMIITYNRMMPGPQLEVCQGDTVVVNITNHLHDVTTSIHWHGMHQKGTQRMDGVPFVTQFPIKPTHSFRYEFVANNSGTHFYHSHSSMQRADGAYGALIVHPRKTTDYHKDMYEDSPQYVLNVADWYYEYSPLHLNRYLRMKSFDFNMTARILVNGVGATPQNNLPPKRFKVTQGKSYRFRAIHAGPAPCPIEIKIVGHKLKVISTDGNDINPIEVDSFYISNGERYDFVVEAKEAKGVYAIHFIGLIFCVGTDSFALLEYEGARSNKIIDSNSIPGNELKLNCINEGLSTFNCVKFNNMTSLIKMDRRLSVPNADFKYTVGLHLENYAPPESQGVGADDHFTPLINNISMKYPLDPFYQDSLFPIFNPDPPTCSKERKANCGKTICECTHLVEIPPGCVIELLLIDEGMNADLVHPMHLHGYNFAVVGQGRFGENTTVKYVENLDRQGKLKRNFNQPAIKDTIAVPDGGYVIIRFISDNIGYWLFHCHVDFHAEEGMQMIFKVQ